MNNKTRWHWEEEKIRKAEPEELIENIKGYTEHINSLIVEKRKENPDYSDFTKFLEYILNENWGPWSHNINKIIKARIKKTDLFAYENDQQRYLGKRLSAVYMYWTKCHLYLQSTFTTTVFGSAFKIAKAFEEMERVYQYFYNLKFQSTPKFIKGD